MEFYWFVFTIGAAFALVMPSGRLRNPVPWLTFLFFLIIVIGLRHRVGGDWEPYVDHYDRVFNQSLLEILAENKDPAYFFLNWFSGIFNGDVYLVNFICAFIFMSGLSYFCLRQPYPWIALFVSIPYFIIVVAMGYTRQSVAIGLLMPAIYYLIDGKKLKFAAYVIAAGLFHKTAFSFLPLVLIARRKVGIAEITLLILFSLVTGILYESYEMAWDNYVVDQMVSYGGFIRTVMNAVPAIILILFRNRLLPLETEKVIWLFFAFASVVSVPLQSLASTAVDRFALYLIPIQILAYSRLPVLLDSEIFRRMLIGGLVAGYFGVLWVWLTSGIFSYAWIPYQNILFL